MASHYHQQNLLDQTITALSRILPLYGCIATVPDTNINDINFYANSYLYKKNKCKILFLCSNEILIK